MSFIAVCNILLGFLFAPLLFGIINRTKAFFAGRKGQPFFQLYYDLGRLLRKGAVLSATTTWVFRLGPWVGFVALSLAFLFVPFGGQAALFSFQGDIILFAYFFGLMRFCTVISALDTGSSFEGMGASREVQFAALAEPAFFLGLAALARQTGFISLSQMYANISPVVWGSHMPILILIVIVFFIVFLAENCRVPVDDPNTHLELTMIHEVMVLDHSGPDFAGILYGAALKFWLLGSLLVGIFFIGHNPNPWVDIFLFLLGMGVLAVVVGIVESIMARWRFLKIPQLLATALCLALLALVFQMR